MYAVVRIPRADGNVVENLIYVQKSIAIAYIPLSILVFKIPTRQPSIQRSCLRTSSSTISSSISFTCFRAYIWWSGGRDIRSHVSSKDGSMFRPSNLSICWSAHAVDEMISEFGRKDGSSGFRETKTTSSFLR